MKTIEILNKYKSNAPSKWQTEAEFRRKNSRWLLYSTQIALTVRQRMTETGTTQVMLAERIGCTQQHISMLLKGNSNLTLETIAKFEEALDFNIIGKLLESSYSYKKNCIETQGRYLSEPEDIGYKKK